MYMQDWLPTENGTGPNNRIISNARAYLDLGFEVEIVLFQLKKELKFEGVDGDDNIRCTRVKVSVSDSIVDRAAYLTGASVERALNYRFKSRKAIRREVARRVAENKDALHHFEYLETACSATGLPQCRAIWSMHDLESRFQKAHQEIRTDLSKAKKHSWEGRAFKYLELAERKVAEQSALTLCIAQHEADFLQGEWGCRNAEFFPMSMSGDQLDSTGKTAESNGKVRVLHLGRIDSLPSYRSLEYLFEKVFPEMEATALKNTEFLIAGDCPETTRAERIRNLAAGYPFVKFLGFQDDLRSLYSESDIQVVASTTATGLRTRIVESFAHGVPVLSSTVGAEGVQGLENNENILLADTPEDFGRALEKMIAEQELRKKIAVGGRKLYDRIYSRKAVADRLSDLLVKYSFIEDRDK